MSDHTPDPGRHRSAAGRVRARSPWLLRYMFPGLNLPQPRTEAGPLTAAEVTWSVRGEPRIRETFGDPHPADFPGGLPLPPSYPV
jgi:hypothetical protein